MREDLMQLLDIIGVGKRYKYKWPVGWESFDHWIEYRARTGRGIKTVRIGFGIRHTYGNDRRRVVVWLNGRPAAEFVGADDFATSGDLLAEIKVPGRRGERMCRYPDDPVPERYAGLPIIGLPTRVTGSGVHQAWAVVANVSDHRMLVALAALRETERGAPRQKTG
jgi:hypothetical protein